jgi:hypothetical protein
LSKLWQVILAAVAPPSEAVNGAQRPAGRPSRIIPTGRCGHTVSRPSSRPERGAVPLQAGAGLNKQDVLLTVDSKEPQLEGSVTLPPGSSWFIIENRAGRAAQIRLQCFAKEIGLPNRQVPRCLEILGRG